MIDFSSVKNLTVPEGKVDKITDVSGNVLWKKNIYTITYRHSNNTGGLYDNSNTGPMDCYALRIGGTDKEIEPKLGAFTNDAVTYEVEYGTQIEVLVTYKDGGTGYKSHNGRIYWNGEKIVDASTACYTWNVTADTDIRFDWVIAGSLVTLNARSWWDCYITTS